MARNCSNYLLFAVFYALISFFPVLGCRPQGIGIGGRYLDGKLHLVTRGDVNEAIAKLESVVRQDPLYKDSLTLLGRAYYKSRSYRDALQILKRSLVVNPNDEIAWITLGMTQLRLGDDRNGLESFKGGLTLLSKVSKDGYRDLEFWDIKGSVRRALRKAIFFSSKGLKEKRKIIRIGEILLSRIDDEEWRGKGEENIEEQTSSS